MGGGSLMLLPSSLTFSGVEASGDGLLSGLRLVVVPLLGLSPPLEQALMLPSDW